MGRSTQPKLTQDEQEIRDLWSVLAKQKLTHFRLFEHKDFDLKGRYVALAPVPCTIENAIKENDFEMVTFAPIFNGWLNVPAYIQNMQPQNKRHIIDDLMPYGGAWVARKEPISNDDYWAEIMRLEALKKPKPTLESLQAEIERLNAALAAKVAKR